MKPILDLIVALHFSRSHMQALLLLVACLVPACMSAQTGNYLTTEKGLSSSVVKQIYQDHYGIIWIATNSGVNVYNGYQMRTYQRNVEQSNSLASNLVNGFCEDATARCLWPPIWVYRSLTMRSSTRENGQCGWPKVVLCQLHASPARRHDNF